ncbi:MAG TPA: hypothetical protein VF746_23575 [Longimicrobium sp.]|jgi:hypothetical protein
MEGLFRSFFLGGFECSTCLLRGGRRVDVIAASGHDRHAEADYRRLREVGIRAARDGFRWHLVERTPGRYDFASALPLVRAARAAGVQVMWDLCHYGWPDWLDLRGPEFVRRFARFARAAAEVVAGETDQVPFWVPVNEISFFSWAAGRAGYFHPFGRRQARALKAQLVRAAIEAIEAVWSVDPRARIAHVDPAIHVLPAPGRPRDRRIAAAYTRAQYEAWDMLAGLEMPELGGAPRYLDVVGVNYYVHNQWIHRQGWIPPGHPGYRPFREILREVWTRYRRPLFVAETGIEGDVRATWLRYVCREARAALRRGVPLEGICLYPIVSHPGWNDDRYCPNGLWEYPDETGERPIHLPLARELGRQQRLMEETLARVHAREPGPAASAEPGESWEPQLSIFAGTE